MERITVGVDDERNVTVDLDYETHKWIGATSQEEIEEGKFPLICFVEGKRFELYGDGTFAEVEEQE